MITIKNGQLNAVTVECLKELLQKDVDVSLAFEVTKIVKAIEEVMKTKEEVEKSLVQKYAKKNEAGEFIKPVDSEGKELENQIVIEDPEKYSKEIGELYEIENKFDQFNKISKDQLQGVKMKAQSLLVLDFMFDL